MSKLNSLGVLMLGGALTVVPALQARTCGGNGDIIGSFGWSGVRALAFVPPGTTAATATTPVTTPTPTTHATTPTATTPTATTPVTGSATPVGVLVAGALNPGQFASVGRVFFDGSGGLFTSSAPGAAVLQSGSYTVNTDCTVSATFTDAFTSVSGGAVGLTPAAQPSATFEGVAVQAGNEIDLAQTGSVTGTTLTLRKTKQNCSSADVFSAFGILASGYVTGATTTTPTNSGSIVTTAPNVPFTIVGRFVSDGGGNLYEDNIGISSPLTKREITGTYTVNTDCTGSATLIGSDGVKRGVNFVEVAVGPTINNAPLALELAFTDAGVVGSGFAQQQ